jgi:hypothetical protein
VGILTIREKVTPMELREMLEFHGAVDYVKVAVDLQQGILVGGGDMHADCEEVLLDMDSEQHYIWGAGWNWRKREVRYDSLINIRPSQNNRQHELQDPMLREQVCALVVSLFDGVEP